MSVVATVREWHEEEGWGVLDAPGFSGGVWAHYSAIPEDGYKSLRPGDVVTAEVESVIDQDGYRFRATSIERSTG
ncbi:MAG: cold shock domain-containing protein [Blastococcus sp.]